MKKLAAGLITLAAFAASLSHIPRVQAESYCDTLSYIVCGDSAIITGFKNAPGILEIPGRINGKKVRGIRENAFYKCSSLTRAILPDTVTSIGHHAFSGCKNLESVEIRGEVRVLEEGCFSGCVSLREALLPDSIVEAGKNSFYKCGALEEISLPQQLEVIDDSAFCGCASLRGIHIPDTVMKIGDKAFFFFFCITDVNIPDSTAELGSCSFGYCNEKTGKTEGFSISGSESSLGRSYAEDNGFAYNNMNGKGASEGSPPLPILPIAAVILSGAGLMFFFILDKIRYITHNLCPPSL